MQNLYIASKSNVRSIHGIKKICMVAEVKPETAREYPISSAGRESPPDAIGEKQKSTNTTSNADPKNDNAEPDRHIARTRGLPSKYRMLIEWLAAGVFEAVPAAGDDPPSLRDVLQSIFEVARLRG